MYFYNLNIQVLYTILANLYFYNKKFVGLLIILGYLDYRNTKLQGLYTILQKMYGKQYKICSIAYNPWLWQGAVPECGQIWSLWTELSWD